MCAHIKNKTMVWLYKSIIMECIHNIQKQIKYGNADTNNKEKA